ncbi:MAG: hypothetical protein AAGF71_09045 [Pseudomonadota bacterium]
MSGTGNCYEFNVVRASGSNDLGDHSKAQNAAVLGRGQQSTGLLPVSLLTFFKTIKAELLWQRWCQTQRQAEAAGRA